jgi:sporulation protein YlmC with PRC-barrel domain
MDIEIDMKVVDKTGKALGTVDQIINDMWSGEPRKYVIMLPNDEGAFFFKPDQVGKVEKGKVTLALAAADIERTE